MTASRLGQLIVSVMVAAGLLLIVATASRADSPPEIRINPASMQVYTGDTGTTVLELDPVRLSHLSLTLTFNPGLITVIDAEPGQPGIQVAINPALNAPGASVAQNQVDAAAGRIDLVVTNLPPNVTVSQVASVTWLGLQAGLAEISLAEVELAGLGSEPVEAITQNSLIEITAAQPGSVLGRVLLQGRRQYHGTQIYVSDRACPAPPASIIAGAPAAITNTEGNFEFVPAAGSVYRCLQLFQHGYLLGQTSDPQGNLGTLELPGGDINDDNAINIFDMAYIGSYYGDNDPQVDINDDGIVSIFDLVLAASNYGRQGPVTQWQ